MLWNWLWISRCGDYWQQAELRTDGACRIMMMMMIASVISSKCELASVYWHTVKVTAVLWCCDSEGWWHGGGWDAEGWDGSTVQGSTVSTAPAAVPRCSTDDQWRRSAEEEVKHSQLQEVLWKVRRSSCVFLLFLLTFPISLYSSSQSTGLSCGCDTGMLHMPKPTNIAELKTALLSIWNGMISHRSSLTRQSCHFERDFDCVLLQLADTLNTHFKYREGIWHSLLKRLKCWRKSFAKFDSLLLSSRKQTHDHLKNWTLKFKLLYLLNHICYFGKICRICGLNPHL